MTTVEVTAKRNTPEDSVEVEFTRLVAVKERQWGRGKFC